MIPIAKLPPFWVFGACLGHLIGGVQGAVWGLCITSGITWMSEAAVNILNRKR